MITNKRAEMMNWRDIYAEWQCSHVMAAITMQN